MRVLIAFIVLAFMEASAFAQTEVETVRASYKNKEYKSIIKKYAGRTDELEAKVIYYVGMSYFMIEDDANALKYLDLAITKGPADYDMYFYKGQTLYYMKKFSDALVNINKAIQMLPEEPDFYLGKSKVFIALHNSDSALATLQVGLRYDTANVSLLNEASALCMEAEKFGDAIAYYEVLCRHTEVGSKEYLQALYNMGLAQLLSGEPTDAEFSFLQYLEINPKDGQVLAKMIQALYAQERYAECSEYRSVLYKLHNDEMLPDFMKFMFCFDQFVWKDKLIMAYEYFDEIDNGFITIKYRFFVTDQKGEIEYCIQTESSPAVRMTEGKYILAKEEGKDHFSYWFYIFNDDFDYTVLKQNVIKILNGDVDPDAATYGN